MDWNDSEGQEEFDCNVVQEGESFDFRFGHENSGFWVKRHMHTSSKVGIDPRLKGFVFQKLLIFYVYN